MSDKPNVFVLSVDSLPSYAFESRSEQIASEVGGVQFTQAVSPGSYTASAMPALATGSLADQVPTWGLPESGGPTPLAEALFDLGYECGLWTDNYLFGATYNYDRGFSAGNLGRPSFRKRIANTVRESPLDRLFGLFEWVYFRLVEPALSMSSGEESFYASAAELNRAALEWLNRAEDESPKCCWLHYMDTHHPYQPPSSYLAERSFTTKHTRSELGELTRELVKSNGVDASNDELRDLQTAFETCRTYVADELIEFIGRLQDRGHYDPDRDVLVVTADHGEVIDRSKYGTLGHVPPAFWEELVRVPLVVGHPDWEAGVVDEQVSLLDLKRIILNAVDPNGSSLSPEDLGNHTVPLVSEWDENDGSITTFRGLRQVDGKKLFGARRDGTNRLLATEPGTSGRDTIVADVDPDTDDTPLPSWAVNLRHELSTYGDAVEPESTPENVTANVDEEHLRSLGYVE